VKTVFFILAPKKPLWTESTPIVGATPSRLFRSPPGHCNGCAQDVSCGGCEKRPDTDGYSASILLTVCRVLAPRRAVLHALT
jgi:hypothetical protein